MLIIVSYKFPNLIIFFNIDKEIIVKIYFSLSSFTKNIYLRSDQLKKNYRENREIRLIK